MKTTIASLVAHVKDWQTYFPQELLDVVVGDTIYDKKYIPIKKCLEQFMRLEYLNRMQQEDCEDCEEVKDWSNKITSV